MYTPILGGSVSVHVHSQASNCYVGSDSCPIMGGLHNRSPGVNSEPVNINFGLGSKELLVVTLCNMFKCNKPDMTNGLYEGTKTHKLAQQNKIMCCYILRKQLTN